MLLITFSIILNSKFSSRHTKNMMILQEKMMRKERKFCSRNFSKVTFKKNYCRCYYGSWQNFKDKKYWQQSQDFFSSYFHVPSGHMLHVAFYKPMKEWGRHKTHKLVENDMVFKKKKKFTVQSRNKSWNWFEVNWIILFCLQGYCCFNTDFVLLVLTIICNNYHGLDLWLQVNKY